MPALKDRLPKYRLHRASGQAVVTLNCVDQYLGRHGTKKSRDAYDRLIAEWLAGGRELTTVGKNSVKCISISQLFIAYWNHVGQYYRKNGEPTGEVQAIKYSLRPLINLYGDITIDEFGPLQLKAVRETMISAGLVRRLINHRVNRIRRMFRWGVENALVHPSILHGLQAVSPLKLGRTPARESKPVKPVPESVLLATQQHLAPMFVAMTEVQKMTGMRPNELVVMRMTDIDRTADVWRYVPQSHKTQHHGKTRMIPLGPRCQAILQPYINETNADEYLFSPKKRMAEWNSARRQGRQTPMTPSQEQRSPTKHPRKTAGDHYTTSSYAQAIGDACERAKVERWGPNRLRHNAATEIRRKHGLDAARAILGHSSPVVTEVYAELDMTKAIEVASQEM